jgi:hypothetical protein
MNNKVSWPELARLDLRSLSSAELYRLRDACWTVPPGQESPDPSEIQAFAPKLQEALQSKQL